MTRKTSILLRDRLKLIKHEEFKLLLMAKASKINTKSIVCIIWDYIRLYGNMPFCAENLSNIKTDKEAFCFNNHFPKIGFAAFLSLETIDLLYKLAKISINRQCRLVNQKKLLEITFVHYCICFHFGINIGFKVDISCWKNDPKAIKSSLEKIDNGIESCMRVINTGFIISSLTHSAGFSKS
ncbi:MAG: hypothetical protein PHV30_01540 [Candidatus Margulisbacteria bacterium]|nr:hypothetical protein [Candidatus Margulisiibacteriota bacterium]